MLALTRVTPKAAGNKRWNVTKHNKWYYLTFCKPTFINQQFHLASGSASRQQLATNAEIWDGVSEASVVLILTQFISSLLCCVGQYKPDLKFLLYQNNIWLKATPDNNLIKYTFSMVWRYSHLTLNWRFINVFCCSCFKELKHEIKQMLEVLYGVWY